VGERRSYEQLAGDFTDALDGWDPDDWARCFAATGARYVVLVAKHHDGWCLWPSAVDNPRRPGWQCPRDVVGELREAVVAQGMRFGVYYSGGLDWTFDDRPIGNLGDLLAAVPRGDYPAYAEAQVRELVARYRPAVLWNDIAWPSTGSQLWPLMRDYYDAVPDGVLNDRWMPWSPAMGAMRFSAARRAADALNARLSGREGGIVPPKPPHFDVRTPEYAVFDRVPPDPWECVRGMDRSFGFNRNSGPEHFLSAGELVAMFADVVAKGGNLLLNVGPRGEDATIPSEQLDLLAALGGWATGAGASVFGSRPWVVPASTTAEGAELRFWCRQDAVWAAVLGRTSEDHVTLPGVRGGATTTVEARAARGRRRRLKDLAWEQTPQGLRVALPAPLDHPVIQLSPVTA
jgi:alpha-L-fucosidase